MENLVMELGMVEYAVPGGGVLRFNPSDPGLYGRFVEAAQKLKTLEDSVTQQAQGAAPEQLLALMNEADARIKALLNETFGVGNDFHSALNGVSLLAVCGDGRTVAQNLFAALETVLEQGAQKLVAKKSAEAKAAL